MLIEICSHSIQSCLAAQEGGAHRVELCAGLPLGGLTPSAGLIEEAVKRLTIPVNVLIRPRPGDFLYDRNDFNVMYADISFAARAGARGVVLGALTPQARVDREFCLPLVQHAKELGLRVTFHRAFDLCADLPDALEDVIALGADTLLTSGAARRAFEAQPEIRMLVQQAAGRLTVMPGSGMNDRNLIEVVRNTGAQAVHMSATAGRQSYMEVRSEEMGDLVDHYQLFDSNEITIAHAVQAWAAWEASQAREASPNLE